MMSHSSLWASPPASEASANRIIPAMNMRRRPRRSARRPPSSRKPPKKSVYALTTQDRLSWEKFRALPIEGSATLTIEASRTTTNWAAASSASASHLERWVSARAMCTTPGLKAETELRFRLTRNKIRNSGSACQGNFSNGNKRRHDHHRRSPAARRCPAQPREDRQRRAGDRRRARRGRPDRRRRGEGRRRGRDGLSPLPEQGRADGRAPAHVRGGVHRAGALARRPR